MSSCRRRRPRRPRTRRRCWPPRRVGAEREVVEPVAVDVAERRRCPIPSRWPANAPPTANSEARRVVEVDQPALAADHERGAGGGRAARNGGVGADGEVGGAVAVDVPAGRDVVSWPRGASSRARRRRAVDRVRARPVAVPACPAAGTRGRCSCAPASCRRCRRCWRARRCRLGVAVDVADAGHLVAEVVVLDRVRRDDPVPARAEQPEVERAGRPQVAGAEDDVGGARGRVPPGAVVLVRPRRRSAGRRSRRR